MVGFFVLCYNIFMDIIFNRRLEVNAWIIKIRWFYTLGFGFLGVLTKVLGSYDFPYLVTAILVSFGLLVNLTFFLVFRKIGKIKSEKKLLTLSFFQISYELLMFGAVFYFAGGLASVTASFFVLPIFLTAILFGPVGSFSASIISGLLVSFIVFLEFTTQTLHHLPRYGEITYQYKSVSVALVQLFSYLVFYLIVGFYLGFLAKLTQRRESMLDEKANQLKKETKLRKKEIEKTKEVKDKNIAIVANLSDPIIVLDEKHRFSLFNPAAREMFGVDVPDLGKKVECTENVCRYQYDLESYKKIIKKDFEVKKIEEERAHDLEVEEMHINLDGEERVYKVITSKVTGDHGQYYGVMKIFYDLTRENRIDKMKSEFISVAAHQLRTPLSAIKWSIDIVRKEAKKKLTKEQQGLLEKSYKSNERMIALVNDLLNVSRIEEGRFGFIFKKYNFQEILDVVESEVKALAENNKVNLIIKAPKKLPSLEIDKTKIVMVLQNLLDNAIKYTPRGGDVVLIIKKAKNTLEVKVRDTGVGIPKREQEKLFSKFFRAENVVRMETEGTGLGLFITKNIIERHGGEIGFKSKEGEGTEFTFNIPIK